VTFVGKLNEVGPVYASPNQYAPTGYIVPRLHSYFTNVDSIISLAPTEPNRSDAPSPPASVGWAPDDRCLPHSVALTTKVVSLYYRDLDLPPLHTETNDVKVGALCEPFPNTCSPVGLFPSCPILGRVYLSTISCMFPVLPMT